MKSNNEIIAKINNFYGKYKLFIGLGVISALLFACPFNDKMWIVVSVVLGLFMLTCRVDELFACMLFMTPFSGLDSLYVITIIMALLILLAKYVVDIIKKRKKIFWFPLLMTLLIVLLSTIKSFCVGERNLETGMLLIFVFTLCYFAFVYRKDISVAKCFNALLSGLFVSAGITLVLNHFDEFKFFIFSFDGVYKRLKMTTFHMNNLALLCIFELAYSVYSVLNKSRKIWIDLIALVFSTILGVLTLSKVFLVMLVIFVLYFMIALVVKFKTKAIKYLVLFAGLVVVLCVVGRSYIAHIIDRMFLYHNGNGIWNEILNGRVDIWKSYLNDFKACWHNILFGVGLFRPNFNFDPHNAYIFMLHRFGILGIIAIGVLIFAYFKCANNQLKISFLNILILFTWLVIGLEETVLSDQFAIYLIFGLMLLVSDKPKNKIVFVSDTKTSGITSDITSSDTQSNIKQSETKQNDTKLVDKNLNETQTQYNKKPEKKKDNKTNQADSKDKSQTDKNTTTNENTQKRKLRVKYTQLSNK